MVLFRAGNAVCFCVPTFVYKKCMRANLACLPGSGILLKSTAIWCCSAINVHGHMLSFIQCQHTAHCLRRAGVHQKQIDCTAPLALMLKHAVSEQGSTGCANIQSEGQNCNGTKLVTLPDMHGTMAAAGGSCRWQIAELSHLVQQTNTQFASVELMQSQRVCSV